MITVKRLVAGSAIAATITTYYTVPAATNAIVKEIIVCNTDTVARTFDLHIVPSAGSAAAANQIFQDETLQAGQSKIISLSSVMPTGATIQALASSASVVALNVSGVEIT